MRRPRHNAGLFERLRGPSSVSYGPELRRRRGEARRQQRLEAVRTREAEREAERREREAVRAANKLKRRLLKEEQAERKEEQQRRTEEREATKAAKVSRSAIERAYREGAQTLGEAMEMAQRTNPEKVMTRTYFASKAERDRFVRTERRKHRAAWPGVDGSGYYAEHFIERGNPPGIRQVSMGSQEYQDIIRRTGPNRKTLSTIRKEHRRLGGEIVQVVDSLGKHITYTLVRPNPAGTRGKFQRCVDSVEARGGAYDPRAVCGALEKRMRTNPQYSTVGDAKRDFYRMGLREGKKERKQDYPVLGPDRASGQGEHMARILVEHHGMPRSKENEIAGEFTRGYFDGWHGKRRGRKANPRSRRSKPGTVGDIKSHLRREAPFIADQYSALWDDMVRDSILRYEKHHGGRISDELFTELHDYGIGQVQKLGLPKKDNPAKPKGFKTEASGTLWYKEFGSLKAAGKVRDRLLEQGYRAAVNQLGGKWRVRVGMDDPQENPAEGAIAVSEEFHGRKVKAMVPVQQKRHYHKFLAELGELRKLVVLTRDGRQRVTLTKFDGAMLCTNEQKNQLFIVGGDQSVDLRQFGITKPHETETLGEVKAIEYFTDKEHLGDEGGTATYVHKFRSTNDNGRHKTVRMARCPDLIYYARDKHLEFSGGSYLIRAEGIDL